MPAKRLAIIAATLLPIGPACWAAEPSPQAAQALEQSIRDWIASTLGPEVKFANRPVQFTPEGDHYAVVIPFGEAPDATRLTATARMNDEGRWNVDNIRLSSPAEFRINLPETGKPGTPQVGGPITYRVTFGQQTGHALFDPSYKTPSTLTSSFTDVDAQASGKNLQQTSHLDRSSGTVILRPAGNDRVDLVTEASIGGYRIDSKAGDTPPIRIGVGTGRANFALNGVSPQRATQVLQAAVKLGSLQQTGSAPGSTGSPKLDPQSAEVLLRAMADFASGLSFDEQVERLTVGVGDMTGSLATARIGLDAKSDAGLFQARLDLGAEGLTLPDLGLGSMAALIPTRVRLRPAVSGIPIAQLVNLAKAAGEGNDPAPADIQALFNHGGITAGLDSFVLDVAGTTFSGMGKVLFTSPEQYSGTAQIAASNLDLLQQRLAADPQTAGVGPLIIFLKGIGRTVENRMVWDVTFRNGQLLVNNQDLTAMLGGGNKAEEGGQKSPARPQPRQNNRPR